MVLVTNRLLQIGRYINGTIFGRKNILLTNCLISTGLGSLGDAIQQHYDIISTQVKEKRKDLTSPSSPISEKKDEPVKFNLIRNLHMCAAGFTTGYVTHFWYILLDKSLGAKRCLKMVTAKVLVDQILYSPVNLAVYFGTLCVCERASFQRFKDELIEKGMENIYIVEWLIWPPAQYINFYLLPLRYRILFDNIISLGFDIYSPYVKYKTKLKQESLTKNQTENKQSIEMENPVPQKAYL